MKFEKIMNNLSLKQKLNQMFITGFEGDNPEICEEFQQILYQGLGGVIFFTQNIQSQVQFKKIISQINKNALIRPFLSIDQEGGRVERTENIHKGKKYLSAKYACEKGKDYVIEQTEAIAKELQSFGINMNFAPVLDVNTNENNPVIGERAFSHNPDIAAKMGDIAAKTYIENGIIPVVKHFPGHGEADLDSHLSLPTIDLDFETLEKNHIKPFITAIKNDIPAIMIAHVYYPCLDSDKIPASLSSKIINEYLIKTLDFKGLIISDDMVMGGVKDYSSLEACIKAINAGTNMFIFRNTDKNILKLINDLEKAVLEEKIPLELINTSIEKIIQTKKKFNLIRL